LKKSSPSLESDASRRHRRKVIGFIIAEASAIGLLLLTGTIAVLVRITDSTLAMSINIVTIGAAATLISSPSRDRTLQRKRVGAKRASLVS